ncbi:hypothetical protein [Rubrivivax sp. A210]|uniref:hypothetical protein n=1 Tax=Rubrivivax sp. A210 TaxID=2772301 RepID=UPI0019180058|nr:hypothetical protein [Rubrivivax sp. A210]
MKPLSPSRMPHLIAAAVGLLLAGSAQAIDFGPFSLTGFAKAEATPVWPYCDNCQVATGEDKQRFWADQIRQNQSYGSHVATLTLFQPYLGVKAEVGGGVKVGALLSQRYRDGKEDFKGFYYDRNAYVSHDDYGSLRVGAMTTRGWSVADYPYGSAVGVADAWGSSGAGYGILTRALRLSSRPLDVAEGDLVLEATYDIGKAGWKKNKPQFLELYAQYHKGDLVVDAMWQWAKNGTPSAFGHGVFTGLTPFPADDAKLGSSSQGIAMVMGRYQVDGNVEISGGLRANRWSGAYAVVTTPPNTHTGTGLVEDARWNNMFNVDWSRDLGGGVFKGYPATSVDLMLGLRYRSGPWTASTGMVHLGAASTANPSDRGQSNSATINTLGLNYNFRNGFEAYATLGMVQYARQGLAPLSMPSNSAFSNVDSRVKTRGNWLTLGGVYVF